MEMLKCMSEITQINDSEYHLNKKIEYLDSSVDDKLNQINPLECKNSVS